MINFLGECSDDHFLDFIELSFQSPSISASDVHVQDLIDDINIFFHQDDLPYHLTNFVFSSANIKPTGRPIFGYPATTLESYPQIVRRDSEVLHETAIEPALTLLREPGFSSANKEFLEALKDYRKGDYKDSVAKCGSSFESVMKVICNRKKWPYKQTDTAETLLNIIFGKTGMEAFFNQPIMLVATMRNRLSSAHGAGTQQRNVPEHRAQFAVNATASAILLLVHETNP